MSAIRMWESDIGSESIDGTERTKPRSGEQDALDRWFDDALPRIFGYFLPRVGGRVHVAEDLTQETMLAAVRTDACLAADEPIAWLFGIARHKLHDHYRRQDRERAQFAASDPEFEEAIADQATLPELNLESLHVRDGIIATLDRLPPRQRSALVFRYLDGLDVSGTAGMLGVSIHAAESLLARGRRSFRTLYIQLTGEAR